MRSADLAELNLEQARLQAQPQAHPYVELQVQEKRNLNMLKVKQLSDLTTIKVYLCISLCVYLARSLARFSLSQYLSSSFLSRCALVFFCRFSCDTKPLRTNVDASRRVQRAAQTSSWKFAYGKFELAARLKLLYFVRFRWCHDMLYLNRFCAHKYSCRHVQRLYASAQI